MKLLIIISGFLLSFASAENSVNVIGGNNVTEASYGDAPWIVSLQMYKGDFAYCGAVLITEPKYIGDRNCLGWIATAASCVEGVPNIIATLGNVNLEEENGIVLEFGKEDIIKHVNYSRETNDYDIALIKVKLLNVVEDEAETTTSGDKTNMESKEDETTVQPEKPEEQCAQIPFLGYEQKPKINESSYGYVNATIFGWGLQAENGPLLKKLHQGPAPLQTDLDCASYYGHDVIDAHSMICAGVRGQGPCSYDTGGPLVCEWIKPGENENKEKYLCGIASFGYGCGETNFPGVFADVISLKDWIDEKISDGDEEEI